MAITVKEKEHWKNRIAEKIERRIEKLVATEQPTYLSETDRKAREEAIGILKLADTLARKNQVDEKVAQLKEQEEQLQLEAAAIVTGKPRDQLLKLSSWQLDSTVEEAIAKAHGIAEREIMSRDELGRTILTLRDEREELLDTIWLATSPTQIRELWKSVATLLDEEPTALQEAALKTDPATDDSQ